MFFNLPSPVQEIHDSIFKEKGLRLFLKRDDLIHPLISGNKWRKLKYSLAAAKAAHKTHLVTFGGAYSNHVLATAAAAQAFGFTATGIVRGEEIQNEVLKQCQLLGMSLLFVPRAAYRDKQALFQTHFGEDTTAYFIDEGGASAAAVKGCEELLSELPEVYDHLFCAAGTGTTAAGILNSLAQAKLHTQMHVIPVFKNGEFISESIARFSRAYEQAELHLEYHFGGYAQTKPELLRFMIDFYEKTDILLDPVYTAKVLWAVFDLAKKNRFKAGAKILVIHTGGITGNWGKLTEFEELDSDFTQNLIKNLSERTSEPG